MCFLGTPKAPPPVQIPKSLPDPAPAPQASDPAAVAKSQQMKKARLAASGANNTLVTGGAGVGGAPGTALKSLYGQ